MATPRESSGRRTYDRKSVKTMHYVAAASVGFYIGQQMPDHSLLDLAGETIDYIAVLVKGFGGLAVVGTFINIIFQIVMQRRRNRG